LVEALFVEDLHAKRVYSLANATFGVMTGNLDAAYVAQAKKDVALQLSRAGVRLAYLLNEALNEHGRE
jgi:hypothetical protein